MSIPTTPQPPYPTYTDAVLREPANYGVLAQLEGTWVNDNPTKSNIGWGLHTTCMPSPGTNTETIFGIFHFLCEDYTEELTFTLVDGGVRNRGGTNEQFVGAVKYNQSIQRVRDGVGIHEEDGMYLWLNQMYNHPADEQSVLEDNGYPGISIGAGANGPNFVPPYSIARSGTIPHGSSILLTGGFQVVDNGKPEFPSGLAAWQIPFLSMSSSMGVSEKDPINLDRPAPDWVHDKSLPVIDPDGNRTYIQRILADSHYPYSARPDLRLRDAIKDQNIKGYTLIELSTNHDGGPQGGILNTPFIQRFARAADMKLRLWIETVVEDGKEILQLQYEQITFFEFMFGSSGKTTRWPHIQINTLRKKA
ncbi:peroxidase, FMP-type [Polyangium sp. 15x6]|uniref:peroxidase, FMP-type n=1 Tax=Polyangium sp. 15x6 TaxID=3042687 RepID=UPI002499EEE9|nr:peroxidase, FMP-type [Polyangium sp. 15x6]MDI3284320.1 peroxidase, FMP-type [Polyangium sp. 15x6]